MSDESALDTVWRALQDSNAGWEASLRDRRRFVDQIVARLHVLSRGNLLYVESSVDEQDDGSVAAQVRAFSPSSYLQIAGEVSGSGSSTVSFATATPRATVTRVALRDIDVDDVGAPTRAAFDLTFANGEVATVGGQTRNEKHPQAAVEVLLASIDALGS